MNQSILQLMNQIENITGQMFHETYPDLEAEAWDAIDSKNMSRLNRVIVRLEEILEVI